MVAGAASLLALAYLITVGGFLSYSTYSWLLRNAPVTQVSTYAFVNPLVAIALRLDHPRRSTVVAQRGGGGPCRLRRVPDRPLIVNGRMRDRASCGGARATWPHCPPTGLLVGPEAEKMA
jgi:hypothetical protein